MTKKALFALEALRLILGGAALATCIVGVAGRWFGYSSDVPLDALAALIGGIGALAAVKYTHALPQ